MAVLRQISFVFPRLAGEQKARVTYDNILRLVDDPDVRDVIKFLREREIVHFQRFGDTKLAKRVDFQTEDNIFVQFYRPVKAKKKASGFSDAFFTAKINKLTINVKNALTTTMPYAIINLTINIKNLS